MTRSAMLTGYQPDDAGTGGQCAGCANLRIFDDHARSYRHADLIRGVKIDIGRRLATLHMLVPAVEMIAKRVAEPHVIEMGADPMSRAGGGDGLGQVGRQATDEFDCSRNRRKSFAQTAPVFFCPPLVEFWGQAAADVAFDRGDESGPAEPGEMGQGMLDARRVSEFGQEIREVTVARIFAFEQHSIEVEDQTFGDHSSNKAVPTRIAVAPSFTAAAKSEDIPMLSPGTS